MCFLECGGTLQQQSGTISSHPTLNKCEWRISTNPGEGIVLSVKKFDLRSSKNCESEYVEVREGYGPKSSLIGIYCGGHRPPREITSTGNRLLVRMKMKGRSKKREFIFTYKGNYPFTVKSPKTMILYYTILQILFRKTSTTKFFHNSIEHAGVN